MELITYTIIGIFLLFSALGGGYFLYSKLIPNQIEEVEKLLEMGRFQEATGKLEKIIEKDDRDMQARYLYARANQQMGNHSTAVMEFRQCLKIGRFGPDVPEIQVRKGLAESLLTTGNKNEAKNEYLLLTTIQPDDYSNYYQVGKLYYNAGVYKKAAHFLSKAVGLNQKDGDSLTLLGQSQFHLAAYQEAKNHLSRAVQLKSEFKTGRYYLGLALRFTGDLEWAYKELEKAEREESIRDRVLLAKGMVLIDQENYTGANSELEKALKYSAANAETTVQIRYLLAMAAEKNRDIQKAIENWEKIEKMKPGYRDVKEKLRQYADFRTHDAMKDFLIAGATQYETLCRKVVEKMNFQIVQVDVVNDSRVHIVASDEEKIQIGARNKYTLVMISREVNAIAENHIRDFQQKMKDTNSGRGIIMTAGEFTPGAINYASTRPLDLIDSTRLTELIKEVI